MSSRGAVLLGIGMLVLGLLIGAMAGGVAGYFMGQNSRAVALGQRFQNVQPLPPVVQQPQPQQPQQQPQQQPTPFSRRTFPQAQNVLGAARVEQIDPGSPAEAAGLKVGDVITAVGSTKLDANHSLSDLILAQKPGDKVDLSVTRGTQTMIITITLGASAQDSTKASLGIRYTTIPDLRRFPNG